MRFCEKLFQGKTPLAPDVMQRAIFLPFNLVRLDAATVFLVKLLEELSIFWNKYLP